MTGRRSKTKRCPTCGNRVCARCGACMDPDCGAYSTCEQDEPLPGLTLASGGIVTVPGPVVIGQDGYCIIRPLRDHQINGDPS